MQIKSKIQIAGAGAGKTYGLAELICNFNIDNNKKVYAITYTNYAKNNIEEKIIKTNGCVPDYISISTIHTFLLNEVIYPYSKYVLGKVIQKASSINLPEDYKAKNKKMAILESIGIVHNEKVFKLAKQILVCNKTDSKNKKERKSVALKHFIASIGAIFVDEAQDLDGDVIEIIKLLIENDIFIYMVGDPKQSLREAKVFSNFVTGLKNNPIDNVEIMPNKNITKRIPKEILRISNLFCPEDQKQESESAEEGKVCYLYTQDSIFDELFNEILKKNGLTYIRKKDETFETQKEQEILTTTIKERLLLNKIDSDDEDAFLYEKRNELKKIILNKKNIKNEFLNKYNIGQIPLEEFKTLLSSSQNKKYQVSSIDKVKGLEREDCLFIVDDSMLNYLIQKKNEWNKEKNYLYVALTRSKKNLYLAFSTDKNKDEIDNEMKKLGISKLTREDF